MKNSKEVQKFIKFVIRDCASEGVKVRLVKGEKVYDGGLFISGYFSDETKEIAVAIRCPLSHWLGVLVHEYAHFCQWRENCKAWRECTNTSIADAGSLIHMWMSKDIELTEKQKQLYLNKTIALELDCEKRAVRLIKQYRLPLDIKEYVQKANAYLASYQAKGVIRKWTSRAAYDIEEIWTSMPTTFTYPYFKKLTTLQMSKKFGKCFKS
jgi:hypothetical protein